MALRLHLLGGARLELDGVPVTGRAAQRRRIAVLALLVRSGRRTLTRERVLAYLWPEHSSDAARRLLSEAIYVVRRDLGEDVLRAVGDEISLAEDVQCDVDEFLEAVGRGDHASAVALYRGPLLDGWYVRDAPELERWVEAERVELASVNLKSLRALTQEREASGDWVGAARGWQAILRVDPYSSTAVLNAARALVAAGEQAGALQVLRAHEALLREDLGVGLDADLSALARDIREGRVHPRRPAPPPAPEPSGDHPPAELPTMPAVSGERGAPSPPPGLLRRFGAAGIGVAAVVLVLGSWIAIGTRGSPAAMSAMAAREKGLDPRRIAVLYFEDQSPDSSLRYVADGLSEGLIRELTDVPALRVFTRDATSRFRAGRVSADSVGRALGAGTVISATLRQSAGRIRVVARLVDAATGEQVATVQVEQPQGELFALEDSLAARTAAALRRRLGDAVRLREARRAVDEGGRNDRALELVLQAERLRKDAEAARTSLRADTNALPVTRARLQAADSMLAVAEAIDPSWARPSLERGWVAATAGLIEHGTARVVALAPGLAHAERALTILRDRAPGDTATRASALYLRGLLRIRAVTAVQTFRPERATLRAGQADLEAAVAADSTLAGAWAELSVSRWIRGDFEGAEDAARRALAADAFLENAGDVIGWAWRSAYARGDRESATRWCRRGRELLPDNWHFIECELTITRLDAAGLTRQRPDPARAWALVRELERVDPAARARSMGRPYSPTYRRLVAAAASAAAGQRDSARAVLAAEMARVRGDAELSTDILYDAAFLHITLGEPQMASTLLDRYLHARPDLDSLIARDPTMRAARAARGAHGR